MTALGQHSMVPPFYANRAKIAPRTRTAREAHSVAIECFLARLGKSLHPPIVRQASQKNKSDGSTAGQPGPGFEPVFCGVCVVHFRGGGGGAPGPQHIWLKMTASLCLSF